jgi:hypothetical protein
VSRESLWQKYAQKYSECTTRSDPLQALCHCLDCRKISGSAYSTNAIFPRDNFKSLSGTPKEHVVKSASGREITSYFWYVMDG